MRQLVGDDRHAAVEGHPGEEVVAEKHADAGRDAGRGRRDAPVAADGADAEIPEEPFGEGDLVPADVGRVRLRER